MKIVNSTIDDIPSIKTLYDEAIVYQKEKKGTPWPDLPKEIIASEIAENRQWKLVLNDEIVCVWVTTFDDPEIWNEKNADPSVYLHRIATNPNFRGLNIISKVLEWTKNFALQNNKKYVRLDTAGINPGLITMYVKIGFKFIEITKIKNPEKLPAHYHNVPVCLFEIKL
ncbi:GNAT family N-acetyltransferase [Flavobacterium sp. ABG]|uniref:GNAT family N-acetyltransferase n=1 Tax=Flavobacterium sp. ABG TaxID=1423322 RepID=UPI00064B0E37|nr:GNAT family N-acetyltransferase [Flavobacterium sp. ABG]KLT70865.1 GNAT family acetyltransferase [Flavobacterium sp. ABG]